MNDPYRGPQTTGGFDFNQPTIIALLYIGSFVTGISGIAGIVLAHVWGDQPKAEWERSHYAYLIRTFWLWLGASVIGWILTVTIILSLIGIPLLIAATVWVVVRSVMSILAAQKQQPMPNPTTLLF